MVMMYWAPCAVSRPDPPSPPLPPVIPAGCPKVPDLRQVGGWLGLEYFGETLRALRQVCGWLGRGFRVPWVKPEEPSSGWWVPPGRGGRAEEGGGGGGDGRATGRWCVVW